MASDNKTAAEAIETTRLIFFKDIGKVNERCEWCRKKLKSQLASIEAAYRREVAELKTAYGRAVSADVRHAAENEQRRRDVADLRKCLEEASCASLSCLSCHSPCSVYSQENDCPLKKRWRKVLEGTKDEVK